MFGVAMQGGTPKKMFNLHNFEFLKIDRTNDVSAERVSAGLAKPGKANYRVKKAPLNHSPNLPTALEISLFSLG